MITAILVIAAIAFIVSYIFYGRFLENQYGIDDQKPTPSHSDYDGIDRIPAPKWILFGHHFSSIAGAGPIVGPILAGIAFGWGPALIWVIAGAVLIGGVHDFSSLMASLRHKARSIAEIAREHMSKTAYKLLLLFIWLALVYILTAFTDLTATTFKQDRSIATSSGLFIILAIGFGVFVYRLKISVLLSSLIFVPLVFLSIWIGHKIPVSGEHLPQILGDVGKFWCIVLLAYSFLASTLPVNVLLQPRDYLSSYLLYASVLGASLGILLGGFALNYPAFTTWHSPDVGYLFPFLFITVACGACSGFHSLVASGTTSKQLDRESDAKMVTYGGMLVEGMVAVVAICSIAVVTQNDLVSLKKPINPLEIYGNGMGKFLHVFGLAPEIGYSLGLLALSTFILTTLDTATRLGRYIFEEFFGLSSPSIRYLSTLATLVLPAIFLAITLKDAAGNPIPAWKAIWPLFGSTNQLLAGLALLVIVVWLKKEGKKTYFVLLPMIFMVVMTMWALVFLIKAYGTSFLGIIAIVLFILALWLAVEASCTILSCAGFAKRER